MKQGRMGLSGSERDRLEVLQKVEQARLRRVVPRVTALPGMDALPVALTLGAVAKIPTRP